MTDNNPEIIRYFKQQPFGSRIHFEDIERTLHTKQDWQSRYQALLKLERQLPKLSSHYRSRPYAVHGCESEVWMIIQFDTTTSRWHLAVDSNARIMRGLSCVLLSLMNQQDTPTILNMPTLEKFHALGLGQSLTKSRSNGLIHIIQTIHQSVQEQIR